jgi:PIN domain nuclease of toxin-antitoxin system
MNPILLDTHAVLWSVAGKLERVVMRRIDGAAERGELLISPITAWEIGMLVRKGRLALTQGVAEYVRTLFAREGVVAATLTPSIAAAASALPQGSPKDPIDGLLIATASAYGAALVTRDRDIQTFAKTTKYLRCIPC